VRQDVGGLAATGSNVTPWLIVAGIIVLLGVIALVVAGIVRSRRSEQQVEDAAETVADAGGTLPAPDPNASASDETVIEEAAELGGAVAAGTAAAAKPETAAPFSGDPAEIAPSDEFAPNIGQIGQDLNAPADTTWPADGEAQPREPRAPKHSANPEKEVPPFDAPSEDDDPSR